MPDEDVSGMPAGGAETPGETMWSAAEKMAAAHEAKLTAEGRPIPGGAEQSSTVADRETERAELEEKTPQVRKDAKPTAGASADLKELEALAKKHGFSLNGNRVEPAERVKMREEKRQARESLELEKRKFQAWAQEEAGKMQGGGAKFAAFEKAVEAGDTDGMAKAAGFKDWRSLIDEHTKRLASPEYRRIQELEKRDREREERDQQAERQRREHADTVAKTEKIAAYKVSMAETMKETGGQLERMSADKQIVDLLYDCADAHYRATGEEPDLEELIETPSRLLGGATPLDRLRKTWESLSAIFGDHPADKDEASKEVAGRRGSSPRSKEPRVPKTVSQRNAAEASGPTEFKSDKEFMAHFTSLLNQSTHTSG